MRIALSFILCLLVTSLSAHPPVQTGAFPDWLITTQPDLDKQPASGDISDGFYYELLDLQTNLIRNTDYTHFIKHIVNATGVQDQSEVSVTFSPAFQQVVFHCIRILRAGATLDQLQLGHIQVVQEETDAGSLEYNGLKRAFLTLKDVRKGDRIEVAYSIIGFNPVFANKYAATFSFSRATAICNYSRTILTTASRPLHILTANQAAMPEQQLKGSSLYYRWTNPQLKPWDEKSAVPDWYNDHPTVYVTEYNSWKDVIAWGLKTFNNYNYSLPATLLQKIAEWRSAANGNKDLLANLAARFVQNEVRYLGLEIGVNTHQPHPPADVWSGRFGDCKDKALLLSVILRHEGIPAFVTLINTTTGRNLPSIAPSPNAFNHVIVAIGRPNGEWIFVDPTISEQRGELTDLYIPNYGYTLLLRDGQDSLLPVHPGRHCDYYIQEKLDARYFDTSFFTVTTKYTGGAADKIRAELAENSLEDLQDSYTKYYSSFLPGVTARDMLTWSDDSLKNELTVNEHYAIPNLWKTKEGKKYFDFDAKLVGGFLPNPSDAAANAPLSLDYPLRVHYTLHLSLPSEASFSSGPLHIKNTSYQFDFTPTSEDKDLTLRYILTTFDDQVPAEDIQQYRSDYESIADRVYFEMDHNGDLPSTEPQDVTPHRPASTPGKGIHACWPAIWFTFFYALFFTRLFTWLNARSEETLYAPGSGYPLGGWIIFLGISIASILVLESFQFIQANYYSYDNWVAYDNAGGASLQYLYMGQLAIHLSFIAGAGANLYWFLKRRDIFPRMFIWYSCILLSGHGLLLLLFHTIRIPKALDVYKEDLLYQLIRTGIYTTVWIAYILRSGQVKSTFLEPYREL